MQPPVPISWTAATYKHFQCKLATHTQATKVDGVYDSDPFKNPHAKKYDKLSYRECTLQSLGVMDGVCRRMCVHVHCWMLECWDAYYYAADVPLGCIKHIEGLCCMHLRGR